MIFNKHNNNNNDDNHFNQLKITYLKLFIQVLLIQQQQQLNNFNNNSNSITSTTTTITNLKIFNVVGFSGNVSIKIGSCLKGEDDENELHA